MRVAERVAKCPKCGAADLAVREVTEVVGLTLDPGPVRVTDEGIYPPAAFWFEPGDILSVHLLCVGPSGCGHVWRSRRPVASDFGADL